jgi:hypothetical protein
MDRRYLIGVLTLASLLFVFGLYLAYGQQKKEATISGDIVCGHCTLKAVDQCTVSIEAADGNYFLVRNSESDKIFGKRNKGLKAKVTGTVEEKDSKRWITASKIELVESR